MENATKVKEKSIARVRKTSLKSEVQLTFKFVNKVILPKAQKGTLFQLQIYM